MTKNQFFAIPKSLWKNESYKNLSCYAKMLYGLMLDRNSLSTENGWIDDEGKTFFIYSIENISADLGCKESKSSKTVAELTKAGLVKSVRQGLCRPNKFYITDLLNNTTPCKTSNKSIAKQECSTLQNKNQEAFISDTNNTDINYTEINNTNPPFPFGKGEWTVERAEKEIKKNLEYGIITKQFSKDRVDELVEIIVEAVCDKSDTVRIGSSIFSRDIVISRMLKLNSCHIEYVIYTLNHNRRNIKNIKSFLLTALFNAPAVTQNYYTAKVNYDLYGEK